MIGAGDGLEDYHGGVAALSCERGVRWRKVRGGRNFSVLGAFLPVVNTVRTKVMGWSCALLLGVMMPVGVRAQDAGKIVEQYIKAEGGAGRLSKVQTLKMEGTFSTNSGGGDVEASGGKEKNGTYTLITKAPNRYYSELVVGERALIEAYNGKSAWHQSGETIETLVGAEGTQLEAAAQYYNSRLVNAKKNKLGLTVMGPAKVRGRDAVEIEVTTAGGLKRAVFFDAQTHLIVKEVAAIGGVDEQIFYDDYRVQDGLKIPFRVELHRGAEVFQIAVTRVVVNGTAGERVFDFPKKSQVQLPDLKALFKEIDENQKAIDKIKENYAGTRTEEETHYDKNEKLTERDLKTYSFFYLDGDEISTLTAKDGKALSDDAQAKENEKTQKEIKEHEERKAKRAAKKEAEKEKQEEKGSDSPGTDVDKEDEPGIEMFLRVSQFVNPRRERFRGQDVLVFDFEPNPEYKARKMAEKVVQKLAGVIWIDEKAHDVARLEAYFVGDFHVGGGLVANLQKGTSFVFEQGFVNEEVWLPTYAEMHVGVRVLMVKGFRVNEVVRYSDYKKFNVETMGKIGAPKGTSEKPQ